MEESRVLVIGDIHEPFGKAGYRAFCNKIREKYDCNTIVFTGDVLDNHYSSFYDADPDGHSAIKELEIARIKINQWYRDFPEAYVCEGNHDRRPNRRMFSSGVSSEWVRSASEVLGTESWDFRPSFVLDGVQYCHGEGKVAHTRMMHDRVSTVQGHYHCDSKIVFSDGLNDRIWSMQVGCGLDPNTYAAKYHKHNKSLAFNVGVVLENGRLPILEPYDV